MVERFLRANSMNKKRIVWWGIGGATVFLFVAYIGTLLSVILSADPLNHPLAQWPIWPVACTTRGCITTASWGEEQKIAAAYATATVTQTPPLQASLTTLIRKHLAEHAFLRSPVKASDVQRYREDILHIVKESDLQRYVPLTLLEYDRQVLTPFLQQEALIAQDSAESPEDLYSSLSQERPVILLLSHFRWDTDTGSAQSR